MELNPAALADAIERLRKRAKEPRAIAFGLAEDIALIAGAFAVLRRRSDLMAAMILERHFRDGSPVPGKLFDDFYEFASPAHEASKEGKL